MGVRGLVGARNNITRVGIFEAAEGGKLAFEGFGVVEIIGDLDIDLLVEFFGDEVDFAISEGADVNLVATAEKLDGDDVFENAAVVFVFGAEASVFEGVVRKIVFVVGGKVAATFDVVAVNAVESVSIAEIP